MNKKFLSLVLALVMVLGTFGSVFAETKAPEAKDAKKSEVKVPEKKETNEKVQWLVDNEIVVGRKVNKDDKNADLALDKDIQRAEVTKLLIYAIGQQNLAARLNGLYAPYTDVPANHWANGLIAAGSTVASPANALPFLHGIGHNMFEPERQVRYDELAKMLVVLVKEDLTKAGLEAAKWPTDWMSWAAKLGIFDGIKTPVDGSKAAVREDAFVMLYNALYKLGELRNLPAGETMGIISDATANKIVLNQGDIKKEFTVSYNTNFVPGKYEGRKANEAVLWNTAIKQDSDYFIGSLVRVIADEKGNVSHIVQLGNPERKAIPSTGWVGVAEKQLSADKIALASLADDDKIEIGTTTIRTNDGTRYFVADYEHNQLTEVKDKAAALALFHKGTTEAKSVYVGYDVLTNSKINEAKVVVFNHVDEDNTRSDVVRVVTPLNNKYQVTAQKAGYQPTEKIVYDLKDYKAGFPLNPGFEKNDVIKLFDKDAKVLIDSSEAPVYEIKDVEHEKINGIEKVNGRIVGLTLTDGKGEAEVDVTRDTKVFFGRDLEKGYRVQVLFEGEDSVKTDKNVTTSKALDIVSVLDKTTALKGSLPYNIRTDNREVTGVLMAAPVKDKDTWRITLKVKGYSETYTISYDLKGKLDQLAGQEITVVAEQTKYLDNAKGYVVEIVEVTELGKAQKPAYAEIDGLKNLDAAEQADLKKKVLNAADKDEVAKIVADAKKLDADNKAAAEKALADAKKALDTAIKDNGNKLKVADETETAVKTAVETIVNNNKVTVTLTNFNASAKTVDIKLGVQVDGSEKPESFTGTAFAK